MKEITSALPLLGFVSPYATRWASRYRCGMKNPFRYFDSSGQVNCRSGSIGKADCELTPRRGYRRWAVILPRFFEDTKLRSCIDLPKDCVRVPSQFDHSTRPFWDDKSKLGAVRRPGERRLKRMHPAANGDPPFFDENAGDAQPSTWSNQVGCSMRVRFRYFERIGFLRSFRVQMREKSVRSSINPPPGERLNG